MYPQKRSHQPLHNYHSNRTESRVNEPKRTERPLILSARDLKSEAAISRSNATLYRILRNEGITNWICKKRPYLSEEVAKKRYEWVQARKYWSWEEWSNVIFSDECSVERRAGAQRQWAFRKPHEKWNKDMIQP